jgi:hypothetical protein
MHPIMQILIQQIAQFFYQWHLLPRFPNKKIYTWTPWILYTRCIKK